MDTRMINKFLASTSRRFRGTGSAVSRPRHLRSTLLVSGLVLATPLVLAVPSQSTSRAYEPVDAPAHGGLIAFNNDPLSNAAKQLYLENADGTHVRQLLQSTTDDVQPTISPDGRHVVFTRQREHGDLPDQIFEVGTNGRGVHQIVPGNCPVQTCGNAVEGHAYSPDGRRLAFTRAVFADGPQAPPTRVELWICQLDGSHARPLTHEYGQAQDDGASWSPDGARIVFLHWVYGSPDQFQIATIAADGTDMRIVTPDGLDGGDPSYSPQGDLISFQSPLDPGSTPQVVYTVRPDGTGLVPLTATTGAASNHPSWSPDGSKLLFCFIPLGQRHGADLATINRDGTNMHLLASTALNENGAFWGTGPGNS
jgi:Tol biopolymer transport system component